MDANLNSTKETFLSAAAKSPPRSETGVFCFEGTGDSPTPPLEDEEDLGLRSEVLSKFKPKPGDQRFDVQQILQAYGETTPNNDAGEDLFSPDLNTPPPNPHYGISGTEARRLALGSPALTVDTDILPIRPPTHEDASGSSSTMDEPDEPMDPISWLDSAICDRNLEYQSEEKKPDPPSKPTPQAAPDQLGTLKCKLP